MPRWGGRWSPSSLIYTLDCSTHMQVRSSVIQSGPQSVNQSRLSIVNRSVSQSGTLVLLNPILTTTTTRCNTACFFSPSVGLSQPSSCHGFEKEDAYVTVTFSFFLSVALPVQSLYASCGHVTSPSDPNGRPSLLSTVPFFHQHPSSIYNDFGAAWSRLLELYILPQNEPGLLLSSSFVRVPHGTILGSLLNR